MKQFLFMIVTAFLGTAGSFAWSPVYGVAVYYLYAVLRPQFLWEWVEYMGFHLEDFQWSFVVAEVSQSVPQGGWQAAPWSQDQGSTFTAPPSAAAC